MNIHKFILKLHIHRTNDNNDCYFQQNSCLPCTNGYYFTTMVVMTITTRSEQPSPRILGFFRARARALFRTSWSDRARAVTRARWSAHSSIELFQAQYCHLPPPFFWTSWSMLKGKYSLCHIHLYLPTRQRQQSFGCVCHLKVAMGFLSCCCHE